jgi:SAM-dependent methyltransferase
MSSFSFKSMLKEFWAGKSMTRSLLNCRLKNESDLAGLTLDLGGGGTPSYLQILRVLGTFINFDRIAEARPSVVADLERPFPIASDVADNVILFNTLEHIFRYQHVVSEMYRVLRPGGKALVYVPFIFPIHTHATNAFVVDDYFRYSRSSLNRIFQEAGFSSAQVEPLGGLSLVIGEFVGFGVRFRMPRFVVFACCLATQSLIARLRPNTAAERYPLGYFVVGRK